VNKLFFSYFLCGTQLIETMSNIFGNDPGGSVASVYSTLEPVNLYPQYPIGYSVSGTFSPVTLTAGSQNYQNAWSFSLPCRGLWMISATITNYNSASATSITSAWTMSLVSGASGGYSAELAPGSSYFRNVSTGITGTGTPRETPGLFALYRNTSTTPLTVFVNGINYCTSGTWSSTGWYKAVLIGF